MSNKKKIVSLQRLLVPVICVVIGGLCGLFVPSFIDRTIVNQGITGDRLLDCVLVLLGFLVVVFFQIIIHEGGHLLFGLLSGYSFSSFRVGPFMLMKQGKEYCLRRMKLAGTGGQCLLAPPDLKDGKIPFVLYNLGGSLLNLISAVLCFLLYIPFRAHPVISVFHSRRRCLYRDRLH